MATYTAQDALKAFEDAWLTIDWATIDKEVHIQTHYELKIAAAKEIEANRIEAEEESINNQTERLLLIKNSLLALDYLCDNSQTDWYKLYNKPKVYGANWQSQANYQISISTGIDYFLNHAYNILYGPYQLDTWYDAGDTFYYNGQLYEVIQGHKTQADWNPETTPALYKKAILANEIPEWVQPTGAQDAYALGVKVTHNGFTWESNYAANVWEPGVFGWTQI